MQEQRPRPAPRRRNRIGMVSGVIAASILGAGAVSAQSPSPAPSDASGTPPTMRTHQRPMGGGGWGSGGGPGYGQGNQGPGGRQGMGQPGMGEPGAGKGGLRGGAPFERGNRQMGRLARPAITVSAITSPTITLVTDDGWTRDVDTTGVTITRNGATITLDDVHVGDAVRLGQTRNEDGTWTITGISVRLALIQGTVTSVDTDSFTLTQQDSTTVTVRVSDTTRWLARRGTAAGLSSLPVGATVVAEGVRAADGSIDAMAVGVRGTPPSVPDSPVTPTPSGSPVATQG